MGKTTVLSKRDVRSLVERLGGTFSSSVTPRTTTVILAADVRAAKDGDVRAGLPTHVEQVLSEGDFCRAAGLPDVDTLRAHYYSARDLHGMYPVVRDDHLRYLEKAGLVRPLAGR